jgi:hypothetical protein
VNTVSELGFSVASTEELAIEAPGKDAIAIQSSGMTKRAKTFPLRPLPLSPEEDMGDLVAGTERVLSEVEAPPEDATVITESTWFATAFEPVRLPRE